MAQIEKKPTILVVDDTADILRVVMELLKEEYSLKIADSPKKALNLLETKPDIDLILLDIMMPEIDGFEVCKKIKQNPFYRDVPIIFLTALADEAQIIKGFEAGAIDYITKPFMPLKP